MVIIPCHNIISLGLTARICSELSQPAVSCACHMLQNRGQYGSNSNAHLRTVVHQWSTSGPPVVHQWSTSGPPVVHQWSTSGPPVVHVCETGRAKELQNEVRWRCCRIQGPLHWTNRLLFLKQLQIVAPFNCCKKNEKHASKDFNKIFQKISKNSIVTSGQLRCTWGETAITICACFWRLLVSRHGHLVSFNMSQPLEPGTIGSMNISSPQKSESCLIGKAQEDSFSSFDHAPNLAISTYQMTYISTFELGNTDRRILQLLREDTG